MESESSSLLSPFKRADYRRLWFGTTATSMGSMIQLTAAAWLMTSISSSSNMVALVQTFIALPVMLFSILCGAVSDSYPRRSILILSQFFLLIISVLLTIFSHYEWITPWQLLIFTFLVGCGIALINPAWQASVGDLVPSEEISSGVLMNSIGFNLSRSIGPALGGIVIAWLGVSVAFAINAATYLLLLPALFLWKPDYPTSELPKENLGRAMLSGIRYVAFSPQISRSIFRGLIFSCGAIAVLTLLPLIVRYQLHREARFYGVILGIFGAGGVLGALVSKPLRRGLTNEGAMRVTLLINAACCAAIALTNNNLLIAFAVFISGACWVAILSLLNTMVQLSAPRWVVARAMSIYLTMIFTGMSLGSWIAGMVSEYYSLPAALFVACSILVFATFAGFIFPLHQEDELDLTPVGKWQAPTLALDLIPSSGPIIVRVELCIREENVPEFLCAVNEFRRTRVRNGAGAWQLHRDLKQPSRWIINYRFPTWAAYQRQHERLTRADAELSQQLRDLHCAEEEPKIELLIERHADRPSVKAYRSGRPPSMPPRI